MQNEEKSGLASLWQGPMRVYVIIAAVLLVIIIVAAVLLLTGALTGGDADATPTATSPADTATPVPTFTPGLTRPPTDPPPPEATPTLSQPIMQDTDDPLFEYASAGARPSVDWTGFFGQVLDPEGEPLVGVPLIVWYADGTPASSVVRTDAGGRYEIRLADRPFAGTWSIQVLTDEGEPASKLMTFQTDEDTAAGIQQIQVIWQRVP